MKYWIFTLFLGVVGLGSFFAYNHFKANKELAKVQNIDFEPGYVTVEFAEGQLGNQMFFIASTLAYAWDQHLIPIFPGLKSNDFSMSHNRNRVFGKVDSETISPVPLPNYILSDLSRPGYVPIPDHLKNVTLNWGFFSWRYFDHHRDRIIDVFSPSVETVEKIKTKYQDLIDSDKTVSVHVRTFSKKLHEEGSPFVGFKFFEDAFSKFPDDHIFVVFSDRIKWTKANFTKKFPEKNFVFIEGNDDTEDFYLMSMMKNHIVSKSTFSWWAAYLNKNPDKRVYIPILTTLKEKIKKLKLAVQNWFGQVVWRDEDYWLPEWTELPFVLEPYPEDIYDYGDQTRSVHKLDK